MSQEHGSSIDWNKVIKKCIPVTNTAVPVPSLWDTATDVIEDFAKCHTQVSIPTPFVNKESKPLGKFILVDKENGEYILSKDYSTKHKVDAKTFDTVMEALDFADIVKSDVIVDTI